MLRRLLLRSGLELLLSSLPQTCLEIKRLSSVSRSVHWKFNRKLNCRLKQVHLKGGNPINICPVQLITFTLIVNIRLVIRGKFGRKPRRCVDVAGVLEKDVRLHVDLQKHKNWTFCHECQSLESWTEARKRATLSKKYFSTQKSNQIWCVVPDVLSVVDDADHVITAREERSEKEMWRHKYFKAEMPCLGVHRLI